MGWLTDEEVAILLLSLRVALVSVVLLVLPGVLTGWLLARRRFPGKALLDALVHLPLVLPPVVTGYLLLLLLGRKGLLGAPLEAWFGLRIAFTWKGAAIAAAVMAFPLMVRAVRLAIELTDSEIEYDARTLGAGPLRVLLTVTLPLAAPGILAGVVLAFARSLLKLKGLDGFFCEVFGGDSFERKKPDPLPLLKTCEFLGTLPARTLMIGDSSNDARAARAAGCPVLLVTYGYNHGEPVHAVDADGFVDSLAELAN